MASSSFSALVQTKSIERVLAPIATQVSNLIILNEASVQDQHAFPDLVSSAEHIFQTVRTLTHTGFKLAQESSDERLSLDMPAACSQVLEAGNNLLAAAQRLRVQPHNISMRSILVESAKKVLEYTVNVLLTSDDAEVRKIISRANALMENLWMLQSIQKLEEFRKHFQHFSDTLSLLLVSCEKRRNELVSPVKQEAIASVIVVLKNAVSMLWSSSQTFFHNPGNQHAKANRDYVVGQILMACSEIIKTVETKGNSNSQDTTYSAQQSPEQMPTDSTSGQLPSGDDLDYCLDVIVRNSLAVAEKCDHQKRKLRIAKACQGVLETRNKLSQAQEAIIANPSSERYRQEFDLQTDKLQQCLRYLDRRVTMAIIAGVCTVFADVETPLQNLVTAATSPIVDGSLLNYNQAVSRLKQSQQVFLDHSSKLCQAAGNASSVAAEPDRAHAIRSGIGQLERLTPKIIDASSKVRQNARNQKSSEFLQLLQQEWRTHVAVLSDLSVDAVSSGDFLSTIETLAKESLAKCREALGELDLEKLTRELSLLVGISEKAAYVCKNELRRAADPLFKSRLKEVTSTVNSVLPDLAALSTDVICNIQDTQLHVKFLERAVTLTEKLGEMRSIVKRSPVHFKENSFEEDVKAIGPPSISVMPNPPGFSFGNSDSSNFRYPTPPQRIQQAEKNHGRNSPVMLRSGAESSASPQTPTTSLAIKNRNSRDIENYLQETRHCLLLGLSLVEADDIQMLSKLSSLLRGSPSSLMSRLNDAVSQSDYALVERRCNELSRRASSVKDFVEEPALRRSKNKESSSLAINTSLEVYESTADVVQLAWKVAANPNEAKAASQLKTKCDEWSEKLDIVRATVDKLVNPWSVLASSVVQAVTLKDQKLYSKQVSGLKERVLRMRELASSAKSAADAEDAVDVSAEGEPPARNQDSLRRIELVMVKSAEMDELTKRFITLSQEVFKNREKPIEMDTLEFLRRDWACKVQSLIYAVDDITVGTSAPVDGLSTAALMGDSQTVRDRGKLLNTYILTLKEMANGCSAGCRDKGKARKAQETVVCVDKLTQEFQDAVLVVQEKGRTEATTVEASLLFMSCVEKMLLLQREWSVKVHLFTSLIDDMTADVSAHVDRLAGAALSVSRVDRSLKLEYLRDFEAQSNRLSSKVARVRNHSCLMISKSHDEEKVQMVRVTCDFLDRLTPQVIAAARGLADNPDQPTVEHFQMLRRQWSSRAHFLMATLKTFKNVQYSSVEVVTRELLASMENEPGGADPLLASGMIRDASIHYHPPLPQRSRTAPNVHGNSTPIRDSSANEFEVKNTSSPVTNGLTVDSGTKERVEEIQASFDVIDGLVTSLSDLAMRREETSKTSNQSKSKRPSHPSASKTPDFSNRPDRSKLKGRQGTSRDTDGHRESHTRDKVERFGSTESLNDDDLRRRTWSPAVLRRTVSFDGLNGSWRSGSDEDVRSRKSSLSIARAAAQLRDEADKWEDENNGFVRVAKAMARQMFVMADMAKKRRRFRDNAAMIDIAKSVANDCQIIWKFANIISKHCVDEKSAHEILTCAESIPTLGTQLSILASVKSATPEDRSAENILVRNAQNLMGAVVQTLRVTEGACMKGLTPASSQDPRQVEATDIVFEWKRKLRRQRSLEALAAERGNLGLRMRDKSTSDPSLVDIVHI